jgi:hypothetical protein
MFLAISPLIALYLRLAGSLKPLRDRHTDPRTRSTCILGSDVQQPRFLRWPLAVGVSMFLRDNGPLWLLVLLLQPLLGIRYVHLSLVLVSCVGFLSCCLAVRRTGTGSGTGTGKVTTTGRVKSVANCRIAAELRPSGECEGSITVHISTERDESAVIGVDRDYSPCEDLAGYVIAMTATSILTLTWLAAQHYVLAMAVSVPLVPTLCVAVSCGSHLSVLPPSLPLHLPYSSPPPSLSAQSAGSESLLHAMPSGSRKETELRCDALNEGQEKEQKSAEMGVMEMDGESRSKPASTAMDVVTSAANAITHDVTSSVSLDLCPRVPAVNTARTSPRSPTEPTARPSSPSPPQAMKALCRGVLCILVCGLCPIGVPSALYSWTVITRTLPGHTSESFSTYFATLAGGWVCNEVSTATTLLLSYRAQRPHHTTPHHL